MLTVFAWMAARLPAMSVRVVAAMYEYVALVVCWPIVAQPVSLQAGPVVMVMVLLALLSATGELRNEAMVPSAAT